ncbi:MAG: HAD family hydrolase [Rhodospirillales bacterium]
MIRSIAPGARAAAAVRGILFDKDGTLVDFDATWQPAYRRGALAFVSGDAALAARLLAVGGWNGVSDRIDADSVLACGSIHEIAALWMAALPPGRHHGGGEVDPAVFLAAVFNAVTARSARPVTDLGALFERLTGRGLILGVATNDSYDGAMASLARFGIVDCLAFVAGCDSGYPDKPDPGMVEAFCATAGLAPSEVMVVGDSRRDILMGRRAGVGICVGVLGGSGSLAALASDADWVIDGLSDLESLLDREA